MVAKTNTQHYQNIANEIRTANDYAAFKSEIEVDNELFKDIGEGIAEKDGGEIPERSELVERIGAIPFFDYDLPVEDNQIKMLVRIHPVIKNCYVNFIQSIAYGVEVDWGDRTSVDTSSSIGKDRYTCATIAHTYNSTGLKIITLTAKQGTLSVISNNGFISFAGASGITDGNQFPNNYYRNALIGISFGNDIYGSVDETRSLQFAINVANDVRYNDYLNYLTIRDSVVNFPLINNTGIRQIKIPVSARNFRTTGFKWCAFLGVVDFTDFTIDNLSQCTFGSDLFTNSTGNGLTILFKDQETAEYAKTITNLSTWADYIKYVGEVES